MTATVRTTVMRLLDDRGECVGEGLLCSENVVVQSGDESTGLGCARRTRAGISWTWTEDLLAHVVYQSFARRATRCSAERATATHQRAARPARSRAKRDDQVRVVRAMPPSMISR